MKALYTRKNKTITCVANNEVTVHESINKAKQASGLLQQLNGGLGCGSVVKLK